jgi:hypothetical protein
MLLIRRIGNHSHSPSCSSGLSIFLRGYFSRCRSSFLCFALRSTASPARPLCNMVLIILHTSFLRGYFPRCRSPGSHLAGRDFGARYSSRHHRSVRSDDCGCPNTTPSIRRRRACVLLFKQNPFYRVERCVFEKIRTDFINGLGGRNISDLMI